MNPIDTLTELFLKFPGIGRRQAKRFVYFLLSQGKPFIDKLTTALIILSEGVTQCSSCMRYFVGKDVQTCSLCSDTGREESQLMLVERDVDLENIEKAGVYAGYYFVLGGTTSLLEDISKDSLRTAELTKRIKEQKPQEIILALSATPEGDATVTYIREVLDPLEKDMKFKLTLLGRGLSTGTELEYSDKDTLSHALSNRA